MACRSTEKANEARDTLLKHTRAAHHRVRLQNIHTGPTLCSLTRNATFFLPQIHVVPLDLCSFHSVREFVEVRQVHIICLFCDDPQHGNPLFICACVLS